MRQRPFNLAIETSDHLGWLTLGKEHKQLESMLVGSNLAKLDPTRRTRRGSDLMPSIESLCQRHDVLPEDLGEVYVSTGPGSFTGLRVALAAVKMFAKFLEVRVVGVPTIQVIAHQVSTADEKVTHLAIALNFKRETAYTGRFTRHVDQSNESAGRPRAFWQLDAEPVVQTLEELFSQDQEPLALLAPALPEDSILPAHVTRLDSALGQPHSEHLWQLGQQAARLGQFTDPRELLPIYARPPEAVELWNQRHEIQKA